MDLALTLDYELFGEGTGDVLRDVIQPTARLLRICGSHGVRITIFFEVVEYWKLKEAFKNGICGGGSDDPTELMKRQLAEAYEHGHDIQLHIHPQWLRAEHSDDGWQVDRSLWRLSSIGSSSNSMSAIDLRDLLARGKKTLEGIIHRINPEYRCEIFRSGGLNIQPSYHIVKAMRSTGLKADSSVFPGGFADSDYACYDYRMVNNYIPWWVTKGNDLLEMSVNEPPGENQSIYELPIFSLPMRRVWKYDLHRLKVKLGNRHAIRTTRTQFHSKTRKKSKLKFLLESESLMWDFCLLSESKMKWFFRKATEIYERSEYPYHPFVLIGHSKEFIRPEAFERFLSYTTNSSVPVEFATLTEVLRRVEAIQSNTTGEKRAIG